MTIGIDPEKLRNIANTAIDQKKKDQEAIETGKTQRIARLNKIAEDLLASIPQELEKAAKNPIQTESGFIIKAQIPIVREHMTGCFSTEGTMSEDDAVILAAVREKLSTLNPSDLYSIKIEEHIENHQFVSNSGTDESELGPCVHYDLIVTANLPK
jgi:hypothetical protein